MQELAEDVYGVMGKAASLQALWAERSKSPGKYIPHPVVPAWTGGGHPGPWGAVRPKPCLLFTPHGSGFHPRGRRRGPEPRRGCGVGVGPTAYPGTVPCVAWRDCSSSDFTSAALLPPACSPSLLPFPPHSSLLPPRPSLLIAD